MNFKRLKIPKEYDCSQFCLQFFRIIITWGINPMDNTNPATEHAEIIHEGIQMMRRGLEFESIRETLQAKLSESELDSVMKILKDYKHVMRRRRGGMLCIVGSIMLVFGCVFVLAMQDSHGAARMAIYLPSIVGSGLVLWGLVDLLGW